MAAARMTQTQLVRHLAERCQVNNRAARQFLDELGKTAMQETRSYFKTLRKTIMKQAIWKNAL